MYISNEDLEFLIHLENRLGCEESWSDDVYTLWKLIEKLMQKRDAGRKKTREAVSERRKHDKNYARSKK